MTTLIAPVSAVVRINPEAPVTATAYRGNGFELVFAGDVTTLEIGPTQAPPSFDFFRTVLLSADLLGGYESFSLPGLPFFYEETAPVLLSRVEWTDGVARASTVLGFSAPSSNYLYLGVIEGDPLPTDFAGIQDFFAEGPEYGPATGAFVEGQDLLSSGILASGWRVSENDSLTGAIDGKTYFTGSGADTFFATSGSVTFDGGADGDLISLLEANSAGIVKLRGSVARTDEATVTLVDVENIQGSNFADILRGNDSVNEIEGLGGDDRLFGYDGDDFLDGGAGNDRLEGGDGDDSFFDEEGDTVIRGGAGDDFAITGSGADIARMGGGVDTATGGDGNDRLFGNGGDDVLDGEEGDDTLEGGNGIDDLFGGTGDDVLRGGNNGDLLDGGAGHDSLVGGRGADVFVFLDILGAGRDRIRDFQDGTDLIDISDYALDAAYVDAMLEQSGSNVRLDLGNDAEGATRMVVLQDQVLSNISAADFLTFDQ